MEIQERGAMQSEIEEPLIQEISLSKAQTSSPISVESDDFKMASSDALKLNGLSQNFKKNVSRKISKALITAGGQIVEAEGNMYSGDNATSKQIIPDKYGYGVFDVVEPTYNLIALSKIYELSGPNFAAINAKASNIVGLGYQFMETRKTNDAIDAITDDKQLERARRKLNKLKSHSE